MSVFSLFLICLFLVTPLQSVSIDWYMLECRKLELQLQLQNSQLTQLVLKHEEEKLFLQSIINAAERNILSMRQTIKLQKQLIRTHVRSKSL